MTHLTANLPINQPNPVQNKPQLALLCNYQEEGGVSMQLCGEMLLKYLPQQTEVPLESTAIQPTFQRRLSNLPRLGQRGFAFAGDRIINAFWDYPQYLKGQVLDHFDWFHVVDHSYAQLVHALPAERTGVFCHDIDAFRCLLQPREYPRSLRYRTIQANILKGFQKAAVVFHTTDKVRKEIEHYNLIEPDRLVKAPLGIAPEFSSSPQPGESIDPQILTQIADQPYLLSVSSSKQRKRLDVLLDVFAAVRSRYPDLKLVRVGRVADDWTSAHQQQIQHLGLAESIITFHGLDRSTLAELYRQAQLVLMTSDNEGFGIPVIEALACGSVVVASDLPVFREVGSNAGVYCSVGEIEDWVETVSELLSNPTKAPARSRRLAQAGNYSWFSHAEIIAQTYGRLAERL